MGCCKKGEKALVVETSSRCEKDAGTALERTTGEGCDLVVLGKRELLFLGREA